MRIIRRLRHTRIGCIWWVMSKHVRVRWSRLCWIKWSGNGFRWTTGLRGRGSFCRPALTRGFLKEYSLLCRLFSVTLEWARSQNSAPLFPWAQRQAEAVPVRLFVISSCCFLYVTNTTLSFCCINPKREEKAPAHMAGFLIARVYAILLKKFASTLLSAIILFPARNSGDKSEFHPIAINASMRLLIPISCGRWCLPYYKGNIASGLVQFRDREREGCLLLES